MSKPLDYDAADDGVRSYYAAIEAKRIRGDDYYLRQPDDPGVEEANPAARPFDWRLIIGLFALQLAVIGAFVWVMI